MSNSSILSEAEAIAPRLIEIRRDIHSHPELGYQEKRTAGIAQGMLEGLGLEVKTGFAGTGLTGVLRGKAGGKTIAIRADMDALPIQEENQTPYSSQTAGVMHACGHDAHVAIALGAAMLLARRKDRLGGNVKFILQPNEEVPPDGAKVMIEEGVLSDPDVDAVIALHVDPSIPVGRIGIRGGPVMSPADSLKITILGRGGHAAQPHLCVDAIAVASQVIQGLQTIISRRIDPLDGAVISIGMIEGGHGHNIVADKVTLTGTVRTLNPALRTEMAGMIEQLVKGITDSAAARYDMEYFFGAPMVVNDEKMTGLMKEASETIVGTDNVVDSEPRLAGEDFSYFQKAVPGCMVFLGVRNEVKGIVHPWHHRRFDIDEAALPIGSAVLAETAIRYLA